MSDRCKKALRVSIGSFFLLGFTSIHADAVWQGSGYTTSTTELSTNTNWSAGTLPTNSTLADFGVSTLPGYALTATTGGLSTLGIVFETSAPASYTLTANGQALSIGTSGVNNNSSYVQTLKTSNNGTITLASINGGINTAGNNVNYLIGDSGTGGSLTFEGRTTGNGSVTVAAGNSFYVNGNSTIGQLKNSGANANTVLNGSLTVTSTTGVPYTGSLSGPGAFIISAQNSSPYDYMYMDGPNTYTGGTILNGGIVDVLAPLPVNGPLTINGGTLALNSSQTVGTLSGTGGVINWNGGSYVFNVNQQHYGTFAGNLATSTGGSFVLGTPSSTTATKTLQLTGNSSNFSGNVVVDSGNLQVNGSLGAASVNVNSGGTLSGTGSFGTTGNLTTIASGGTLSPGNSVGTVTNQGNQVFNNGSFFTLQENGLTSSTNSPGSISLLIVNGTTTVGTGGAPTVNLVPVNGLINLNTTQPFIESAGGLTVVTPFNIKYAAQLTNAGFNLDLLNAPTLTYDANNYYITTQTSFADAVASSKGGNKTAEQVAAQFDSIVDPNTAENLFLNGLAKLSTGSLVEALDDASGSQYATEIFGAEISNRQFLRRLYDPIRQIVTTEPDECCLPVSDDCFEFLGVNLWGTAGGGQTRVNGRHGVRFNEWDVTVGAQQTFWEEWTFGIAGSYEHSNLSHHFSQGSGKGHSWFGGLYGLYRPSCWYVLGDVAYGYRKHDTNRHLFINDTVSHFEGNPHYSQTTLYAEAGWDYTSCSFLIQPFVGLEVGIHNRKGFTETDVDLSSLSLIVNKQNRTVTVSSLGVHLTDQFCSDYSISIDLAWLYRFTNNNHFKARFASITPGATFDVYGADMGRNSGEGAITIAKDFCDNWRVFVEASGEVWRKASTYNVLGGIQVTW